jgi:hypothetical protein
MTDLTQTMSAATKRQPSQLHSSVSAAFTRLPAWLQQREQLAAAHLLVDGYRPLMFVMQQSLHFIAPLALLLGVSFEGVTTVVTKRQTELSRSSTPEIDQ